MISESWLGEYTKRRPAAVMTRGALEYAFADEHLDEIFRTHATSQYEHRLLFSSMARLLSAVVMLDHATGLVMRAMEQTHALEQQKKREEEESQKQATAQKTSSAVKTSAAPKQKPAQELSSYYIVSEINLAYDGMDIVLKEQEWQPLRTMTPSPLARWLTRAAQYADWKKYLKAKRGPKKPVTATIGGRRNPHRSTYKLLQEKRKLPKAPA